jgi:23S rRNA (adenine2503-C2)-methyltransferase
MTASPSQNQSTRKDIRALDRNQLVEAIEALGQPAFRAKQIESWIWDKGTASFEHMTNLGAALQKQLAEQFELSCLAIGETQVSRDGTVKIGFEVAPGQTVEGVLIPTSKRMTACISSQVGCSLSCAFCATGRLKLLKNLTAGEIVDQVRHIAGLAREDHGKGLSNIVYMGMGEPLLNYRNVMDSIDRITGTPGLGMSPSRITVSTAGIAKMIRRMGDDQTRVNLALSLHAATDEKRNEIMAINETNDLASLRDAIQHFYTKTGTRPTFEYVLLRDFNDRMEDARALARFARCVPCKINLIEYNPIDDGKYQRSHRDNTEDFQHFLEDEFNMIVNVRRSRGEDIDAACGQLAGKS